MPVVAGAVAGGLVSGAVAGASIFAFSPLIGQVVGAVVGFVASSVVSNVFGGNANKGGAQQSQPTFQAEARDRLITVRSAVEPRRIVYGQVMVSGPLVYAESTSDGAVDNNVLHLVIPLAGHEVQEIGDIYFNDEVVPFASTGEGYYDQPTSGRFIGYAAVVRHLGGADQAADASLLNATNGIWTSAHRLRGVAYVYIVLVYDPSIYPSGVPNIKCVVKGKKVRDPRVGGSPTYSAWSNNWALCVRDYIASTYGLGCSDAEIDDTAVIAAANICDEQVALDATPTYQVRYTCDGTVTLADRPIDILKNMLGAAAGTVVFSQGTWKIHSGAYATPAISVDEDWLRGPVRVQARPPRRELYNGVRGTFSDPERYWQPTDFSPVTNGTYETQDGGEQILRDIELPFTTNAIRAQRIAKIHLEKSRQGIRATLPCNLKAFQVSVWDTIQLTIDVLGWDDKVFLVTGWRYDPAGGVDLDIAEEASAVYDWAYGDATELDAAPDTNLPDPFGDLTIAGLTASSGTADLFRQGDGTIVPRVRLRWTQPANPFVKYYEVQFARVAGSPTEYVDAPDVAAPAAEGFAYPVEDGVAYDLRIRAVTTLGNAGDWAYVYSHTVAGKTALPSDVAGFSAVQSAGVVVFGAQTVEDADLDTIEIRRADLGNATWDDAEPTVNILRGQTATNKSVPPGEWTFLAKARDTSGNYSANAARVDLEVTAEGFTTIEQEPQAVDWRGSLTNMVRHWTGVLTPESQSLASELGWDVFDEFVPDAYTDCYYEAPVIDKGIDAAARIYGDIVSVLGPGETTGVAAPMLEVDTRTAAGSFDGFEAWTVGTVTFRYMSARIHVDTTIGKPVITEFTPTVDAESREESGTLAVGGGGSGSVSFGTAFHNTPVLQLTPQGSGDVSASYDSLSTTGFTGYFKTAGVAGAGTISYTATGA